MGAGAVSLVATLTGGGGADSTYGGCSEHHQSIPVQSGGGKEYRGTEPETLSQSVQHRADPVVTFEEFSKDYANGLKDIPEFEMVTFFVERYRAYVRKDHPPLRVSTWEREIETLFLVEDEYGRDLLDREPESVMPDMIENYFHTSFADGCDYALLHFNSGQVRTQRVYALRDKDVP